MTKQEYMTRMGYKEECTDEEFRHAEEIYMAAGQMHKNTFCAEYKKVKGNALVEELYKQLRLAIGLSEDRSNQILACENRIEELEEKLNQREDRIKVLDAKADLIDEIEESQEQVAYRMIDHAQKVRQLLGDMETGIAADMDDTAAMMVGRSAMVAHKLRHCYHLTESDRGFITEKLTGLSPVG